MPGQKFRHVRCAGVRQSGEDVGEPGLGIDVVQLRGDDQGIHERGAVATALGTGKQPGLAAEGDAAQGPFGRVVRQADPAVVEDASEGGPAVIPEHVVDRLGDGIVLRHRAALGVQPVAQRFDQGAGKPFPGLAARRGIEAIDLALDVEDRVDPVHCFQGNG